MAGEALESPFTDASDQIMKGENSFAQVPDQKIQEIHALAYWLYQNQQYQEASHFFRLLIMARPSEAKFWKSFGACLQMQKDYEEAINCYLYCSQLMKPDQVDPYLYVQTADCYFALKQVDAGFKALEVACSHAKKTQDKRILKHVALMRQLWT